MSWNNDGVTRGVGNILIVMRGGGMGTLIKMKVAGMMTKRGALIKMKVVGLLIMKKVDQMKSGDVD